MNPHVRDWLGWVGFEFGVEVVVLYIGLVNSRGRKESE